MSEEKQEKTQQNQEVTGDVSPFTDITKAELEVDAVRVTENLREMFRYKPWTLIGVSAGGLRWTGMIMKAIEEIGWTNCNMQTGLAVCKLYIGTERQEHIKMNLHGSRHIFEKRKVVCFDDIVDSGTTRRMLGNAIVNKMGAKEVFWSAMLIKEKWKQQKGIELCGRIIPDDSPFVVGMGLDHNEKYRDLDVVTTVERAKEMEKEELIKATTEEYEKAKDGVEEKAPFSGVRKFVKGVFGKAEEVTDG